MLKVNIKYTEGEKCEEYNITFDENFFNNTSNVEITFYRQLIRLLKGCLSAFTQYVNAKEKKI